MSLAKSPAWQCASRAASALPGRRPHPHPVCENSVWTLSRRQEKRCVFVAYQDLVVAPIFYHLSAGLDKFYGFCSAEALTSARHLSAQDGGYFFGGEGRKVTICGEPGTTA